MDEVISLDSGLEEELQSSIGRCCKILEYLGCVLEFSLESTVSTSDGVTLMNGWYRIINVNGMVVASNNRFICGVTSYLLNLRGMTPKLCYGGSVARCVIQKFGLVQ